MTSLSRPDGVPYPSWVRQNIVNSPLSQVDTAIALKVSESTVKRVRARWRQHGDQFTWGAIKFSPVNADARLVRSISIGAIHLHIPTMYIASTAAICIYWFACCFVDFDNQSRAQETWVLKKADQSVLNIPTRV